MKNILLIGCGRFGQRIAKKLNDMNADVMAVDRLEERVSATAPYVTSAIIGDATDAAFLKTLGIRNFDTCIVAVGDDVLSSIEITSLLKDMGATHVVSRASKNIQEKLLLRNGADEVVFPEKQAASWTAVRVGSDHIFDYLKLDDNFAIYEVQVPEEWVGHTIGELNVRKRFHVSILAVKTGDSMEIAVGNDFYFTSGDMMFVIGSDKDIQKCFQ